MMVIFLRGTRNHHVMMQGFESHEMVGLICDFKIPIEFWYGMDPMVFDN